MELNGGLPNQTYASLKWDFGAMIEAGILVSELWVDVSEGWRGELEKWPCYGKSAKPGTINRLCVKRLLLFFLNYICIVS